jgi:NAD(P)-dependent dehydrogenase (short-subunit alcohol dehydrogenase family)
MTLSLTGKTALVTGGSRGIGAAIAAALCASGARVMLTFYCNDALAEAIARQLTNAGGQARCTRMNGEETLSVRAALAATHDAFGPIDILVNNAAMAEEKPFETITEAELDRMMAVNFKAAFTACQKTAPKMAARGFGRIVNIASIGGQWGGINQVHYAAAKAALISLTRSLARCYSGFGVTSNAVAPGLIDTDMAAGELGAETGRQKVRDIPAGRVGTPEEVAAAVAFLVSDQAGYITGQTLNLNGGMYFR